MRSAGPVNVLGTESKIHRHNMYAHLLFSQVAELAEVQWLVDLPDLRVLWLSDNPCADIPKYRQKVRSDCS